MSSIRGHTDPVHLSVRLFAAIRAFKRFNSTSASVSASSFSSMSWRTWKHGGRPPIV
jgi:hypothetical protein